MTFQKNTIDKIRKPLNEKGRLIGNEYARLKQALNSDYGVSITDLDARVTALEGGLYNLQVVTANHTTAGSEIVICNNTTPITVTLDLTPSAGDSVHIKRKKASVTVAGTIDGSTNKKINLKYYSMFLVFDGTEWSEI